MIIHTIITIQFIINERAKRNKKKKLLLVVCYDNYNKKEKIVCSIKIIDCLTVV